MATFKAAETEFFQLRERCQPIPASQNFIRFAFVEGAAIPRLAVLIEIDFTQRQTAQMLSWNSSGGEFDQSQTA
ncbi:MAG: hypothetical protein R3C05_15265 [Pirellulaceae bacterium]